MIANPPGMSARPAKRLKSAGDCNCPKIDDEMRAKPIVALALVQHNLQRAEPEGEKAQADVVNLSRNIGGSVGQNLPTGGPIASPGDPGRLRNWIEFLLSRAEARRSATSVIQSELLEQRYGSLLSTITPRRTVFVSRLYDSPPAIIVSTLAT
jgi:hypothetical protein